MTLAEYFVLSAEQRASWRTPYPLETTGIVLLADAVLLRRWRCGTILPCVLRPVLVESGL